MEIDELKESRDAVTTVMREPEVVVTAIDRERDEIWRRTTSERQMVRDAEALVANLATGIVESDV